MAAGGAPPENADALSKILRRLETGGKPVVAAINGTALGGGYEIALACHHRICASAGRIRVGLPEATLGLLPGGGGTQRLPRMIGIQASAPLLMEGKQLRPAEALAAGLIDAVVPAAELLDAARTWLSDAPRSVQPWDEKGYKVPGGGSDSPEIARMFMVANAMYRAKTYGNYPAGQAILSAVWEGLRTTIDAGLLIESRYFASLLADPVAGNMVRTLFLGKQRADGLVRRPADVPKLRPTRVGVLGAGLMGSGIAYAAAKAGLDAVVIDLDLGRARGAWRYVEKRMQRAIKKGWKTAEQREALKARIHPSTDYGDLADCQVVIEAVFEDRGIKAAVTGRADAVLGDDVVLASNTSTLPITGLAAASSRPERFIGLHFFSPVEKMPLVEVIVAEQTAPATLAWALDFVRALGKTPIVVRDSRGFYTSRVFSTYVTEGMVMLSEGVAPALIENAGKMSGMPMPPLGLADAVGLGLMHQVGRQTRADLGDAAPANPSTPVLEALVETHKRTGARGKGGFYDYNPAERSKRLWRGLAGLYPPVETQPDVPALIERFLMVQAVETARCLVAEVVQTGEDADVGAILGWGFAPYTGGPASYIRQMGVDVFVARAAELAEQFGDRFRPPEANGLAATLERS